MRANEFHRWLLQANELTPSQHQQAIEWFSQELRPEDVIGSIVEPEPACPYCPSHTVRTLG
jgi:hypothetical protein